MRKNILNNNQKKILYKNIGILFALTVLCAVLVRSGLLNGGETLQDLAEKQQQTADAPQESETVTDSLPGEDQTSSEKSAASTQIGPEPQEKESPQPDSDSKNAMQENKPAPQEGENVMPDRVTYQDGFYYESLSDAIKIKITGISYPADDTAAAISYDTLRFVNVLYYDFSGNQQNGELICHKAIAQDLVEIFYELYEMRYPVEKITLIDDYQGDDELSMQDNNTSCFNYRALPSGKLSNHAYGLAIDLNPFYNPYVTYRNDGSVNIAPAGSEDYADRERSFEHKINAKDPACKLFIQHGFTWGGNWRTSKDYQHFEKKI